MNLYIYCVFSFFSKYSALTPSWNLLHLPWPMMLPTTWTLSHAFALNSLVGFGFLLHFMGVEKMENSINYIEQDTLSPLVLGIPFQLLFFKQSVSCTEPIVVVSASLWSFCRTEKYKFREMVMMHRSWSIK